MIRVRPSNPWSARKASGVAALAAAALALCLAAGCSDDPNASGSGLIPDTLTIVETTTIATSDSNFFVPVGGNQAAQVVAAIPGYEARALLRLVLGTFDTTSRIDSAVVTFRLSYRLPDSGGAVSFTAHAMTKTWSSATFRWDSVAGSFAPAPSGSFSGTVTASDTAIRLKLDTALIRSWLPTRSGSVMLVPAPGGAAGIGYHSPLMAASGLQPAITVYYRGAADTTLRASGGGTEGVFVATGPAPPGGSTTILQSGVAWRGLFRFDSLALPREASIAQAYLEVRRDGALPAGPGASRDTITVSFVQDRAFPLDTLVLSGLCTPVTEDGVTIYRADIKTYVQLWNTREPNAGVVLRPLGELTTLDRFGVFNASAADSLRPRIRITYVVFP